MLRSFKNGAIAAAAFVAAAGLATERANSHANDYTICIVTFSLQNAYFQSSVPGGERAAEGDGRNILETATAEAENMLTANPGIDVIYATGDPQLQGGLAAGLSQGREIAFFGWDDIPEPFLAPLEDGRLVGFLKQSPDYGGEQGVRLLVAHLNGEAIPNRVAYNPSVVTPYNLDQFR